MNTYVYEFGDSLYLNITNRCPNNCEFCIREFKDGVNENELWLKKEPSYEDMIEDISLFDLKKYKEAVFCGFGEPTCNLSMISQIAPYLKKKGMKIRINTNGLANLINNRTDVAKILAPYVDTVSISLNASTAEGYQEICRSKYGEEAFYGMLEFARNCVKEGIRTIMTVVDFIGEDEVAACGKVAQSVGAEYRVRVTIREEDKY